MVGNWSPARVASVLYVTGYIATVTSISALVLGLLVVQVGASDLRATLEVSGEAMEAIVDTVDVIEDVTSEIRDSIDAAADGVSGVSATATIGAESIEEVAVFLEEDLPADLDAIRRAMPAAVQAAGAIDGTLRALRFVGVSYSPEEPFDDSLRSVEAALADMPDDLRSQSESLRNLVPAATRLAGEADRLALALTRLGDDLAKLEGVTQTYDQTLTEASATIDMTGSKLDRNLWLLRIALAAMAIAGVALGVGLIAMSRFVDLNLSTARVEVTKALAAGSEDR
jgi:enamine deaminase RidA (YjgF/YER057c/UK114 family)